MFVETEVMRQLAQVGARQTQPVRLGGSVRNEEITYVYRTDFVRPNDGSRDGRLGSTPLTGDDVLRNMETDKQESGTSVPRSPATTPNY
jgi:hypothetical protein